MSRSSSTSALGVAGRAIVAAVLVVVALFAAYAFGAGYTVVHVPTPLNVVGSIAVLYAAWQACRVVTTGRRETGHVADVVTAVGAFIAALTLVSVLV